MSKQRNTAKKINLEDVMRACWFARLAFGDYAAVPPMPETSSSSDPLFSKRTITSYK